MIPMEDLADVAKPGWVPLVILILMFVVVFFLWRSMRKMLHTIEPGLPHEGDEEVDAVDDSSTPSSPR
ncbi:MAG TPA: hypothetical protein IAA98_08890 [Candidatus Avipropionibacterium avicola]|uniref:Uncharacterized protein n=1 Tax=Candidatus Avipropionibacterium avicola TaxID=2840701 RepID=A0A9D1GYD8_9ACTN|nr:hypothetical protein [Candidatus Avipropionibacterium avicola]